MKDIHVLIITLSVAVWLSASTNSSKSSQYSNENSLQNSVNTDNIHKTDELSYRLKQYKSFLRDEITSETKSDGDLYLSDFCNWVVPGETEDGISYALYDMTGDGLPELHVLTDISYSIHTIENDHLITWYEGDRYCRPLNNGVILEKIESTGTSYGYYFLDSNGEMFLCVGLAEPPKGVKGNYYFSIDGADSSDDYDDDYGVVPKKKWNKLSRPFFAMSSDKIIWKYINDLDF